MIKKFIVVLAAVVILAGCGAIGIDTEASSDDIQGTWILDKVSGTSCFSGLIEYEFEGSYDYYYSTYDNTVGTVSCDLAYDDFDYEFDESMHMITIDGASSANAGLVDGNYYVFINDDGDEMAWEFEESNPITAYVFTKTY